MVCLLHNVSVHTPTAFSFFTRFLWTLICFSLKKLRWSGVYQQIEVINKNSYLYQCVLMRFSLIRPNIFVNICLPEDALKTPLLFHDGGLCHTEISPLIWSQWNGFYMTETTVLKELIDISVRQRKITTIFLVSILKITIFIPASIYLLKVNNRKTRTKVWNMFKVNNKDTKTPPLASFWCLYC